jgi:predicted nucleic acid-binding protein
MAEIVIPATVPSVIKNDPPDNQVLACAAEGQANIIVSGDKHHLLPLKEYKGIPIVRPGDFLRMLGGL